MSSTGLRLVVWALVVIGLLGYLALGSVSAVSYRYSSFLQQTFREVEQVSFFDIWTQQIRDLPTSEWLLSAGFTAAIAVSVAGVAYGTWLLLVSSGTEASGGAGRRMRYRRAR